MHWTDCTDIRIVGDDEAVIYVGPKFLRCVYSECSSLVTHGQIEATGTCLCGGRKYRSAVKVTRDEEVGLTTGKYLLNEWELVYIGDDTL